MTLRLTTVLLLLVLPCHAMAQTAPRQDQSEDKAFTEVQQGFAAAYNRGDADAMAAAFTENAIRVTPSGIFQGRDAIRRSFRSALSMGLHDYSVQRTIARSDGDRVFHAGEWQATLKDQPFHGYYTAILVREGNVAKIMEETVTIALP
jgi:uncharacterized protein (TIGR02246 family)